MDGAWAEYAVGYARQVVRVPDGISSADAAPLSCAGVTTYKAVKASGANSSSLVAIYGAGGLGHLAIQYARITGATVVAVDINPARLETALELGAHHVVNASEEDPVAAIQRLGGADAAVSVAVAPIAFEQAFRSLASGGTLVCVGLPSDNQLQIPIFETVLGGLHLQGSIVGTRHDLEQVLELHRRGLTRVEYAEIDLDDVNASIEHVLDGTAVAPRLVFRMIPEAAAAAAREAAGGALATA
jgi:propanol-preferring alcohol dehydrogenase